MSISAEETEYHGPLDRFELGEGYGEATFRKKEGTENYEGNFKRGAFNGDGHYLSHSTWAYEGNFQSNCLTGYGTISYGDATIFSGLFKNDRQYGPGVLTYPDGRQDVGIWRGSQIYRLSVTVGSVQKLSITQQDRLHVAKFKSLIPINYEKDVATQVLLSIGKYDELKSVASNLYSRFCKNPESNLYDHAYFSIEKDDHSEIDQSIHEKNELLLVNETPATNFINTDIAQILENKSYKFKNLTNPNFQMLLLSWNNNYRVIEIMKHSFKYRQQEHAADYEIGDILCGRRKLFRARGPKEIASTKVLLASSMNDVKTILEMMQKYTLDIDVMDNKGNSMIIRAAANDALDVIRFLHTFGADIDAVNDEGFSALTHTLSRYIAHKYDVQNWAQGFLPEIFPERLDNNPENEASISIYKEKYIFDLSPQPRKKVEKSPTTKAKRIDNKTLQEIKIKEREKETTLLRIEKTAIHLLDIGVNLHSSNTPESIMVLAIFSGRVEIVKKLLQAGADPNAKLSLNKGGLTALHVISQARPLSSYPEMAYLLIQHGAKPNLRTSRDYNEGEWSYLVEYMHLESGTSVEGMTPLHIICLRSDATYVSNKQYLEQVCCLLSWYSDQEELFLGLSPLGLAISKANYNIVNVLLSCADIDVNATYDKIFWGNPLSTYLRCLGDSNTMEGSSIMRSLILHGVDPLVTTTILTNEGNALNMIAQLNFKLGKEKEKKSLPGYHHSSIITEQRAALKIKELILADLARLRLRKHIRGFLTRLMLRFIKFDGKTSIPKQNEFEYTEVCKRTEEWMDSYDEFKNIIKKIVKNQSELYSRAQMITILSLAPLLYIKKKNVLNTHNLQKFIKGENLDFEKPYLTEANKDELKTQFKPITETVEECLNWIDYSVNQQKGKNCIFPELDSDKRKYVVCYKCLKQDLNCKICPKCRLVYFCSMRCNLADASNPDDYHQCAFVFWGLKPDQFYTHQTSQTIDEDKRRLRQLLKSKLPGKIIQKNRTSPKHRLLSKPTSSDEISQLGIQSKVKETDKKLRTLSKKKSLGMNKSKLREQGTKLFLKKQQQWERPSRKGKLSKGGKSKIKISSEENYLKKKFLKSPGLYQHKFGGIDSSRINKYLIEENNIKANTHVETVSKILQENLNALLKKQLETEKLKETQEKLDVSLLGEISSPEEFWDEHEMVTHSLKERFLAFMMLLQKEYGKDFDIDDFFPFVVFVDGQMYYKPYGKRPKFKENYSFN